MLSLAITCLFTLTGIIAAATVADSLVEARKAYVRLMREGEVMRAGFALQAAAVDMALRRQAVPAPRRAAVTRRDLPRFARPLCAAA